MAKCDVCGNEYDKAFIVTAAGRTQTFDSFECAIHALAPVCAHCGCRVVGHGVEHGGTFYCCAHCAKQAGHLGPAGPRVVLAASSCSGKGRPLPRSSLRGGS